MAAVPAPFFAVDPGRYCAKFIPNQNYPFPIRIVMLSALSKYSLIDSFLAYEQKGLRADTLSAAKRMEDNMMYPIKDQETMLAVPMDMNRQQDTGYRIEI
uniref:Uncharacterized protein n=1 Tax=Oryza nivara TaxID=4536 RepID=A0A0E0J1T0_ORYNI